MKLQLNSSLLFLLISFSSTTVAQRQSDNELIENQIKTGNFTQATQLIDQLVRASNLTELEKYNLLFKKDVLDRIRIDFSLTEQQIKDKLKPYEKFVLSVTDPEYGCKDFFTLKDIKEYVPEENPVNSNAPISSETPEY